jgi:hypothetical protein
MRKAAGGGRKASSAGGKARGRRGAVAREACVSVSLHSGAALHRLLAGGLVSCVALLYSGASGLCLVPPRTCTSASSLLSHAPLHDWTACWWCLWWCWAWWCWSCMASSTCLLVLVRFVLHAE